MRRSEPGRPPGAAAVAGLVLAASCLVGCGSTSGSSASAGPASSPAIVTVTLSNAGCVPDRASVPAGSTTFHVVNSGGDAVSEVELTQNGQTLAEKENLAPGLSGDFTVQLAAGAYGLECDGATTPSTPFTVTPIAGESSP